MNENLTKQKVGRPKGKTINWAGVEDLYKVNSNREIAEKYGTSVVNVFLRRRDAIKAGLDATFEGNPDTGTKPKKRKLVEI